MRLEMQKSYMYQKSLSVKNNYKNIIEKVINLIKNEPCFSHKYHCVGIRKKITATAKCGKSCRKTKYNPPALKRPFENEFSKLT